jgi:CRP-like cAMP-binding protein
LKNILKDMLESPQFPEGSAWKRIRYNSNDIVVKEGDEGDSLFFVEEGELSVTRRVGLGDNKHIQPGVGKLKAGAIFGESCLHSSLPRIASVTAITEVQLLEISGESLGIFLDDNPVKGYLFYKKLFEAVIGRLNNVNQTVESLMAWGLKAHEIDQHL